MKINVGKNIFLFIVLLFVSVGCGFRLSSGNVLAPELQRIYISADKPYDKFARDLKKALYANGVTLVKMPGENILTLYIGAPAFSSSDLSLGPSTQAHIYSIHYSVGYSIRDAQGKTVVGYKTISAWRDLTLPPNEVFDASTQVNITKQNLEQEAIVKMLNMLSSKETTQLVGAKSGMPVLSNKTSP